MKNPRMKTLIALAVIAGLALAVVVLVSSLNIDVVGMMRRMHGG